MYRHAKNCSIFQDGTIKKHNRKIFEHERRPHWRGKRRTCWNQPVRIFCPSQERCTHLCEYLEILCRSFFALFYMPFFAYLEFDSRFFTAAPLAVFGWFFLLSFYVSELALIIFFVLSISITVRRPPLENKKSESLVIKGMSLER